MAKKKSPCGCGCLASKKTNSQTGKDEKKAKKTK